MVNGRWGKKIGMTQVFSDDQKVVPVTAIDIAGWYVTQIKTQEKDGYDAVQVGHLKDKYRMQDFDLQWLKKAQKYFSTLKEVRAQESVPGDMQVGQKVDLGTLLNAGDSVDVFGTSIGKGFAGVVKRHGFAGGRASHGATMGRYPGSIGFMTSQGRVIKGKKLPGHLGNAQCVTKRLEIVKIEPEANVMFVKGSVPGKSGSLVFVKKS
jgi:large subunit ribosomal protein L3